MNENFEYDEKLEEMYLMETEEVKDNDGITKAGTDFIEQLKNDIAVKQDEIVKYIATKQNLVDAIKAEEKRLGEYRKSQENKLERFKNYVKNIMEVTDTKKVETNYGSLTLRKSPISVEVTDLTKVPPQYIQTKVEQSVDKKAIIADFKDTGELVEGVKINTNNNSLLLK